MGWKEQGNEVWHALDERGQARACDSCQDRKLIMITSWYKLILRIMPRYVSGELYHLQLASEGEKVALANMKSIRQVDSTYSNLISNLITLDVYVLCLWVKDWVVSKCDWSLFKFNGWRWLVVRFIPHKSWHWSSLLLRRCYPSGFWSGHTVARGCRRPSSVGSSLSHVASFATGVRASHSAFVRKAQEEAE